ncbi:hypothetical protein GJ496_011535 [Pomphorhynchus laevis]|nr:hypothetical protein GJ496_011535 [Pomphorhynchus laevis]
MGWTAVTGMIEPGAVVLSAVLYLWQFPHFNALNWLYREEYVKAGYKMMCTENATLFRWTTVIHGLAMVPLCFIFGPTLTNGGLIFSIDSLVLNLFFAHLSVRFAFKPKEYNARSLFIFTLCFHCVTIGYIGLTEQQLGDIGLINPAIARYWID